MKNAQLYFRKLLSFSSSPVKFKLWHYLLTGCSCSNGCGWALISAISVSFEEIKIHDTPGRLKATILYFGFVFWHRLGSSWKADTKFFVRVWHLKNNTQIIVGFRGAVLSFHANRHTQETGLGVGFLQAELVYADCFKTRSGLTNFQGAESLALSLKPAANPLWQRLSSFVFPEGEK